jgi:hypothetical protein
MLLGLSTFVIYFSVGKIFSINSSINLEAKSIVENKYSSGMRNHSPIDEVQDQEKEARINLQFTYQNIKYIMNNLGNIIVNITLVKQRNVPKRLNFIRHICSSTSL